MTEQLHLAPTHRDPLHYTSMSLSQRSSDSLILSFLSLLSLSGVSGCEEARRVQISSQGAPQGLPPLIAAGQEGPPLSGGMTSAGSLSGDQFIDPPSHSESLCTESSLWDRLTPRRLRPLTRSELENTWAGVIAYEPLAESGSNLCPPYSFEVSREALGVYRDAQTLHIASELNQWAGTLEAGGWPLELSDDQSVWRLTRDIPSGRHLYKLVVDETHWVPDPHNSLREDDGFGGENSVIEMSCEPTSTSAEGLSRSEALSLVSDALRGLPATPRPSHYPFSGHVRSDQTSPERIYTLLTASRILIEALPNALGQRVECVRSHPQFDLSGGIEERLGGLDPACAAEVIEDVSSRLMRAPLSSAQRERLLNLARSESLSVALRVAALSPEALYRSELGLVVSPADDLIDLTESDLEVPEGETLYALSSLELANALSFALWGAPPDQELSQLGQDGALYDSEILRAQAERLLNHPQALTRWGQFGVEWLGVEETLRAPKRADLFPHLTDSMRAHLLAEMRALVGVALLGPSAHNADGLHEELTASSYGVGALFGGAIERGARAEHVELRWLNNALIDYYQLDPQSVSAPLGGEVTSVSREGGGSISISLRRVSLSDSGVLTARGGVLGAGATLLSYAHSDQTSPILRGLFVRERLLCQTFGPPPPNAGGVPEVDPNATTRERFRQHSDDPSCSGCHRLIDEVGFGFEGFDAVGRARESEAGLPIDTRGTLAGLTSLADPNEDVFTGLGELASLLAESPQVRECLVTQLRRAMFGMMTVSAGVESISTLGSKESCHLSGVRARFLNGEISIRDAIVEIVLSLEFRLRRSAPMQEIDERENER